MSVDVCGSPFITGTSITNEVVGDCCRLLLQRRSGFRGVGQHRLVVTINESWLINSDSHHTKFITESFDIFARLLHCDKFTSESARFTRPLFLGVPVYRRSVQENDESGARTTRDGVASVVAIHEYAHGHALTQWLRHIRGQFFAFTHSLLIEWIK